MTSKEPGASKALPEKQKKKRKRKNDSSLSTDISCCSETSKTGSDTGSTKVNKNSKSKKQPFTDSFANSENYVETVMNPNTSANMSNMSNNPIITNLDNSARLMSTPCTIPTPPIEQAIPPSWALKMMDDIKTIKDALPKIEKIEKTVTTINLKVYDIEIKLGQLERRVQNCEDSCSFVSDGFENQKKKK